MMYLVTQIALSLLAALLVGVILGWFTWGRRLTSRPSDLDRIAELEADVAALEAEIAPLRVPNVSAPRPVMTPAMAAFE